MIILMVVICMGFCWLQRVKMYIIKVRFEIYIGVYKVIRYFNLQILYLFLCIKYNFNFVFYRIFGGYDLNKFELYYLMMIVYKFKIIQIKWYLRLVF